MEKTILYYPTIKIEDGMWLRNALLYWDNVASIVPNEEYEEQNSIEVEYLKSAGIYKPVYPQELLDNLRANDAFCKQIKSYIRTYNLIKNNKYDIKQPVPTMMISRSKMNADLYEHMLKNEIAIEANGEEWLAMDKRFARRYMSILARYLSSLHEDMEIGTDIESVFLNPYAHSFSSAKCSYQDVEEKMYLDMVLQNVLPVPNMDVSLQDVIDFKMEHQDKLRCFRRRLEKFQFDLQLCKNTEQISTRVCMFQREIDEDLQEIEELMKSRKIFQRRSAFRTCFSCALDVGISYLEKKKIVEFPIVINVLRHIGSIFPESFINKEEIPIKDDSAYLFYASEWGMIRPYKESY